MRAHLDDGHALLAALFDESFFVYLLAIEVFQPTDADEPFSKKHGGTTAFLLMDVLHPLLLGWAAAGLQNKSLFYYRK